MASRAAQAVPLLLQSPPGQVPNVYEDLLGLIGSDGADVDNDISQFKSLAETARSEYNVEQLVVVDVPQASSSGSKAQDKAILCKSAVHPGEADRFLAPRCKTSFKVDHATLTTSDARPYEPNQDMEPFRAELDRLLALYIQDKYATGMAEVYAVPLPRRKIEVPAAVKEEAMAVDAEQQPSQSTGATIGEEKDDVAQASESEEQAPKPPTAEADGDSMSDAEVKDDPVEVAKAMEGAEEEKVDTPMQEAPETKAATIEGVTKEQPQSKAVEATPEVDEETHGESQIVVHIVANKYKLSNFWSGRWRSTYTLASPSSSELDAHANVQVHYFEEGNVQLHTKKASQLSLEGAGDDVTARAKAIVRAIQTFEDEYEQELFKNSSDLGEGAFKALRRHLPMTRQKIDWDKVLNYKLGSELSKQ